MWSPPSAGTTAHSMATMADEALCPSGSSPRLMIWRRPSMRRPSHQASPLATPATKARGSPSAEPHAGPAPPSPFFSASATDTRSTGDDCSKGQRVRVGRVVIGHRDQQPPVHDGAPTGLIVEHLPRAGLVECIPRDLVSGADDSGTRLARWLRRAARRLCVDTRGQGGQDRQQRCRQPASWSSPSGVDPSEHSPRFVPGESPACVER